MRLTAALAGLFLFLSSGIASAQDTFRPGTVQAVTVATASTAAPAVLGANTRWVRLISTSAAHVAIGVSPQTATSANMYLAAGVAEYFTVTAGQHIAVIRSTADGTLYITELTQ